MERLTLFQKATLIVMVVDIFIAFAMLIVEITK